jgi:DNA-binding transcriptional LysR family regulator
MSPHPRSVGRSLATAPVPIQRKGGETTQTAVSLAELGKLPLVMPAHPDVARVVIERTFTWAGLVPAEADTLFSIVSAVQSGAGDAILPTADVSGMPGQTALTATPIDPPMVNGIGPHAVGLASERWGGCGATALSRICRALGRRVRPARGAYTSR